MLNRWIAPNNPILAQQLRAYRARTPRWMQRANFAVPLMLGIIVILFFLFRVITIPDPPFYRWFYHSVLFYEKLHLYENSYLFQLCLIVILLLFIARYVQSGVVATRLLRQTNADRVTLTGIPRVHFLVGVWASGLHPIGIWMAVLGFVRLIFVLMVMLDKTNQGGIQFVIFGGIAIATIVVIGVLEGIASVGLGIAFGTWVPIPILATILAVATRALPVFVFSIFPIHNAYVGGGSYDSFFIRWWEYTWMSIADGGITTLLRLTVYYQPIHWSLITGLRYLFHPRTTLSFLSTFLLLGVYVIGSAVAALVGLRRLGISGAVARKWDWRIYLPSVRYPPVLPILFFAMIALGLSAVWLTLERVVPMPLKFYPYYNRNFLRLLQVILAGALAMAALPALNAGVRSAQRWRALHHDAPLLGLVALRLGWAITAKLRGWVFGVSFLFLIVGGLLITEHMVNRQTAILYDCDTHVYFHLYGQHHRYECYIAQINTWLFSQWFLAMFLAIAIGFGIVYSSILIGLGVGMIWKRRTIAFIAALAARGFLPFLGLSPPNIFTLPTHGLLASRLSQDPLFAYTDGGLTAFIGVLDMPWSYGDARGLTLISYALLVMINSFLLSAGWVMLCLNAHRVLRVWQRWGSKRADIRRSTVSG